MSHNTVIWLAVTYTALCGTVLFGITLGGAPERIAGIAFASAAVLSRFAMFHPAKPFVQVEWGIASIDFALLIVMIVLAMYANRFWPIAAAAIQLFPCFSHIERAFDTSFSNQAYARMASSSLIPTVLLLFIGTVLHRKRVREMGADPSWTDVTPPVLRSHLKRLGLD